MKVAVDPPHHPKVGLRKILKMSAPIEITPTSKLLTQFRQNLSTHPLDPSQPATRYVILLQTGSFCPIHLSHVSTFSYARAVIHARFPNTRVLAAYISPSHDLYVSIKLNSRNRISATHRVAMARLATAGSDWIDVDAWEAIGSSYFSMPLEIAQRLQQVTRAEIEQAGVDGVAPEQVEVWYIGGADLVYRAAHGAIKELLEAGHMVVCAWRPTPPEIIDEAEFVNQMKELMRKKNVAGGLWEERLVFVEVSKEKEVQERSSTAVRERLLQGLDVKDMVGEEVARYITENKLWILDEIL